MFSKTSTVSRYSFRSLFNREINSWGHQVSNATSGKLGLESIRLWMRSRFVLVVNEMVRVLVLDSPALRSSTSTKNTEIPRLPNADVLLKRAISSLDAPNSIAAAASAIKSPTRGLIGSQLVQGHNECYSWLAPFEIWR